MHPGPMNRGVEIASDVADGAQSLIREQVEMGVALRMAVLEALASHLPNGDRKRRRPAPPRPRRRLVDPRVGHRAHGRPPRRRRRHPGDRAEPVRRLPRRRADRPCGSGACWRRASSTCAPSSASRAPSTARPWPRPAAPPPAGGVTTVVCMPDTNPPVDDPPWSTTSSAAPRHGHRAPHPAAALTKGLAGREMTSSDCWGRPARRSHGRRAGQHQRPGPAPRPHLRPATSAPSSSITARIPTSSATA